MALKSRCAGRMAFFVSGGASFSSRTRAPSCMIHKSLCEASLEFRKITFNFVQKLTHRPVYPFIPKADSLFTNFQFRS